jgi:hypothetical protein
MHLRLVSSSDDRALAIRDHLLPLVRDRGTLECQRASVRLIALQLGPWLFNHWTPFNELSPEEASSPGTPLHGSTPGQIYPTGSTCGAVAPRC